MNKVLKPITICALSVIICALSVFFTVVSARADTTLDQYQDILIAPGASPLVRNAASDLQYHLQEIAGRPIPLKVARAAPTAGHHFIVGPGVVPEQEAAISQLPQEGWMIRSLPNGLLLAGSDKGKGYFHFYHAVPLFLEKYCGVRWVWPGKNGEVIPHAPALVIPTLNETGVPHLRRRRLDFYYARYWTKENQDALRTWAGRSRSGDQFTAVFGHSWHGTMPGAIYFKEHPEWYGLVEGERRPAQLCPSNMEMRDEFLKRLLSRPDYQKFDIVSVSANDGGGFCECNLCQAKGVKGESKEQYQNAAYWDFVNDIAQRVKVQRPDLGVGTFAYTISRNPPKHIERLPDNVYLSMTTYSTQMMLPEGKEQYQAFVNEWKSKGVQIVMRDYWGMHYWMDLPILYPDEIAGTVKQGVDSGMIGIYGETGKHFSTQAPNYYVLTHMMWDPNADPQAILNDFYSTFGPAAKPVREYHEYLENEVTKAWNKYKFQPGYTEMLVHYGDIFTPAVMAKAATYLDEAKRLAGNDEKLQSRIAFVRVGCDYTTVMGELLGLYDKLGRSGVAIQTFNPLMPYKIAGTASSESVHEFVRMMNTDVGRANFMQAMKDSKTHPLLPYGMEKTDVSSVLFNRFVQMLNTDAGRANFTKVMKEPFAYTPAQQKAWLERAWELGQQRFELLNQNRSTFALDEGLAAVPFEYSRRLWHQAVGKALGKTKEEEVVLEYTHPVKKQPAKVEEDKPAEAE